MPARGEIKSDKVLVKDIFSNMWFRIPEYQRPYVWGSEEISDLLEDLTFAMSEKADFEYFLGSFVFQHKPAAPEKNQPFKENDLLDGQQRLATLLILFAVLRDLAKDQDAKEDCQDCIYQKASKFKGIPERTRLVFAIREDVQNFIDSHIKPEGAAVREDALTEVVNNSENLSVRNMAAAAIQIDQFFQRNGNVKPTDLLKFLLNKVLLIYVSTEDLEDAFRLFTILNNRGIPLRNSDILKAVNLGALDAQTDKIKCAKMWEEAENELGDDFDRFLQHIRTILLKDKARLSLLQEFEDKIYDPKEKDQATGKKRPPLLKKGKPTFQLIEQYLNHYRTLFSDQNYDKIGSFEYDNCINLMLSGLPSMEWIPPLLRYFDKFKFKRLLDFLKRLNNKFSADWICQSTPTERIEAMNKVLQSIDEVPGEAAVFRSGCFNIDARDFGRIISEPVYGKRFCQYILLRLDYLFQNHDQRMQFERLSVEHVLPQNPANGSKWIKDFTPEQRIEWTDKLGNLVLITRRKNSSLGRLDYSDKMDQYFAKCIDSCPNSLRVLQKNKKWTPAELKSNHELVVSKLLDDYRSSGVRGSA